MQRLAQKSVLSKSVLSYPLVQMGPYHDYTFIRATFSSHCPIRYESSGRRIQTNVRRSTLRTTISKMTTTTSIMAEQKKERPLEYERL